MKNNIIKRSKDWSIPKTYGEVPIPRSGHSSTLYGS